LTETDSRKHGWNALIKIKLIREFNVFVNIHSTTHRVANITKIDDQQC